MIINTFSYLWASTAIDAIADLTRHGYRVFEIPVSSPHCWPDDISSSVRMNAKIRLQDYGASVRSLNAGGYDINLASPGANMRRKSIDHIKDVIDLAVDWEVADVVISPGTRRPMISPPLGQTLDWLYESLEPLLHHSEQAGVQLLLENTPYCFRPTIDDLIGVVKDVGSPHLKIVYDVANAAYIGENPAEALRKGHPVIGLVHVSDTGLETWGHDPIGTGIIDFTELGKAIVETCTMKNSVLEIIREKSPLYEIDKGISDLRNLGWTIEF